MNEEIIFQYFKDINDEQRAQFRALGPLYQEWNAKINVISRKDIDNLYMHHVLHSLGIAKVVNFRQGSNILDIGTGSGCIAVSLAKNLEEAEVVSWDVSEKALQVAERNCRRNGVRVILEQRDVLLASPAGERFDVIVSNPPYITEKERADMSANVLEWEPELALFVPDDSPLLFYRKIAELGRDMLVSGGRLYFEINQEYGRETVDMLAGLEYKNIKLRKDLFQNDRMIKAEK